MGVGAPSDFVMEVDANVDADAGNSLNEGDHLDK
ncbi:hypothetical protein PC116_g31232 [Phytophthora cactorum]|nr:hypothetical protein PC116_g31232 [Phytophthora cactorum]